MNIDLRFWNSWTQIYWEVDLPLSLDLLSAVETKVLLNTRPPHTHLHVWVDSVDLGADVWGCTPSRKWFYTLIRKFVQMFLCIMQLFLWVLVCLLEVSHESTFVQKSFSDSWITNADPNVGKLGLTSFFCFFHDFLDDSSLCAGTNFGHLKIILSYEFPPCVDDGSLWWVLKLQECLCESNTLVPQMLWQTDYINPLVDLTSFFFLDALNNEKPDFLHNCSCSTCKKLLLAQRLFSRLASTCS